MKIYSQWRKWTHRYNTQAYFSVIWSTLLRCNQIGMTEFCRKYCDTPQSKYRRQKQITSLSPHINQWTLLFVYVKFITLWRMKLGARYNTYAVHASSLYDTAFISKYSTRQWIVVDTKQSHSRVSYAFAFPRARQSPTTTLITSIWTDSFFSWCIWISCICP